MSPWWGVAADVQRPLAEERGPTFNLADGRIVAVCWPPRTHGSRLTIASSWTVTSAAVMAAHGHSSHGVALAVLPARSPSCNSAATLACPARAVRRETSAARAAGQFAAGPYRYSARAPAGWFLRRAPGVTGCARRFGSRRGAEGSQDDGDGRDHDGGNEPGGVDARVHRGHPQRDQAGQDGGQA